MTAATLAWVRKFLVALAGAIGQCLALGLLDGSAEHWAQIILGFLTALGVLAVPNAEKPVAEAKPGAAG